MTESTAEKSPEGAGLLVVGGYDEDQPTYAGASETVLIGNTDIFRLLGGTPPSWLHVSPHFLAQHDRPDLHRYSHVLNLVTDADQNPRVLDVLSELLDGFRGKIVNRPEAVRQSSRPEMASRLAGIPGLIVPKIVRLRTNPSNLAAQAVERAGLRLPALLRFAGTHTGRFMGRFDSADGLDDALANSQHLITEFVDFQSADGLYRKYRVFFIGRYIILRHLLISPHWNVHARTRTEFMAAHPELVEEEKRLFVPGSQVFPPEVLATLKQVRKRVPLDFFGMDFALVPDGRAILFEANATMNFFPFIPGHQFAYIRRCITPAAAAMRELVGLRGPLPTVQPVS